MYVNAMVIGYSSKNACTLYACNCTVKVVKSKRALHVLCIISSSEYVYIKNVSQTLLSAQQVLLKVLNRLSNNTRVYKGRSFNVGCW